MFLNLKKFSLKHCQWVFILLLVSSYSAYSRVAVNTIEQLKKDNKINIIIWQTHFSSGFRAWRDRQSWYEPLMGDDWGEDESIRDIENLGR
ncbi:MAG: hypothetical protein SVR94_01845 [Pseudomonadota bacterium]|nr:hypothetical protein [Pseudomonadota bacterium]